MTESAEWCKQAGGDERAESRQKEKKKRGRGRWTKTTNKGGHGFVERGEENAVSETWRKIRSEGGGEERGEERRESGSGAGGLV